MAASILTTAYYVLRDQVPYRDLGPLYFAASTRIEPRNAWHAELKSSDMKSEFEKQPDQI